MSTGINVTKSIKILDEGVQLTADVSQIDFTGGVTATTSGNNVTVNVPAAGITVGTTPVTSGTNGRVFFQAGGVVQQDAGFLWDTTNKRMQLLGTGVIAAPAANSVLEIKAKNGLSDIAFRVRNSADSADIVSINGNGSFTIGIGATTAGFDSAVVVGRLAQGLGYDCVSIGKSSIANNNSTAVGAGALANGSGRTAIGYGANAADTYSTAIGFSTVAGANSTSVGRGANTVSFSVAIGGLSSSTQPGNVALGFGVTASGTNSIAIGSTTGTFTNPIGDSFQIGFASAQSLFVNKNTNIVLKSQTSLTSGTHFEAAATNTITIHNGTAPVANITDAYAQYSADITAGNAAPHFRTENGDIIKLYRETTAVGAATLVSGSGTTLTDTDTFDGYTLEQVVKALRNLGILA